MTAAREDGDENTGSRTTAATISDAEGRKTFTEGTNASLLIRMLARPIEVNPITITASRRPEKLLDSPAAVTVLTASDIESRTALTAASHLASVPGVDLIKTGLVSSRIVIRGFNANGVVHIITRSPFDSRGTEVSLARGEQDVLLDSIRHAGTYGKKIGYKFSLQYYTGSDFPFNDPVELDERRLALQTGASPDTLRIGQRNFDVQNLGFNGRIDFRLRSDLQIILNGGITRGDNIEVTPTGAAQVDGASVGYIQARLLYKDLFVQGYGNFLNSGDSYFPRTGQVFKDKSKLLVLQAQHHHAFGPGQRFTYGADLFYTIPDGEGTVTGRNENSDQITEFGGYVQSETTLRPWLKAIGSGRLDYHDRLDEWTFSPRAALVFKPAPTHNFRLTYNLAFKTPTANDLFSDVLGLRDVFQLGRMQPLIGFAPTTDLRVQGVIQGFHFDEGPNGRALFRSPFAPLAGLTRETHIELGDPEFTNVMWDVARRSSVAGLADTFVAGGLLTQDQADAVSQALDTVLPDRVQGVDNTLKTLDLDRQEFVAVSGPTDFEKVKVTSTRSFEFGYKGVIARAFIVRIDVYHTRIKNFLGPFQVGTPNVFLDIVDALRCAQFIAHGFAR